MASEQRSADSVLREQWTNATQPSDPTPAGYTAWDDQGNVTTQRALTTEEAQRLAAVDSALAALGNQAALITKAQTALAANNTYVSLASPSSAQIAAQVKMLTRENTAIIKLLLRLLGVDGTLDDTNGT